MAQDVSPQVHYAPGERPLCGAGGWTASYTDDPAQVAGCVDCLELVAEDLQDENSYRGRCLHCRQRDHRPRWSGVAPDGPCALPALRAGRMVMGWTAHDRRATH